MGIDPQSYSLDGGLPAETYVLAQEAGGWVVYYSERGSRMEPTFFDAEDEACDYLLLRLTEDPTTRQARGISPRIRERVRRDFDVERRLAAASNSERFQAAVVFSARGDLGRFDGCLRLLAIDWRDLLVGAGLADDDWADQLGAQLGDPR
jgi:hypothetical protein